ncbi:beta-lactamase hydrolase domain-containing protein [Litorimonas sp.]|uniref:beta-lactamase hydrolase domain-containing protein n=1 Tax=Litorimonas sp. TaxID=1892381 RepID=UPI003A89ADA2
MYELPGDVFVCGQLLPAQLEALKDQGIQSFINNRPDQEAPLQPLSEDMEGAAQDLSVDYHYIPMLGGLTSDLIEASSKAYENTPRPIVAFCASGMRSAALWAFAHVKTLGSDAVIKALEDTPYNLSQIYPLLKDFEKKAKDSD